MQVMRGIVALLLAEPKAELSALQAKLQACLGVHARILTSVIPEMAALLGSSGPPGAVAAGTVGKAGLAFLQAIASPSRPLVIVLDDLQWAPPASLKLIGGLIAGGGHPGLMTVAASRDVEADAGHPLAEALRQWEAAGMAPRRLRLENLPSDQLSQLLGDMLRLPPDAVRPLADAVIARTGGNPFDTVELLNGLHRDGTLRRHAGEWHWDGAAIHRHIGQGDVTNLLQGRIRALPAATQNILANMACLGSESALDLLAAASHSTAAEVEKLLTPGLDAGLLVSAPRAADARAEPRFSNHRVLELTYDGMEPCARQARHLALARRLAPFPAYTAEAAEQYLPAATLIPASNEAKRAAELFEAAAAVSTRVLRHDITERYHDAAIGLLETLPAADEGALVRLRTARLNALYCLGRYDDADLVFARIGSPDGDPLPLAEASCVQVLSLCNRARHQEAVRTGLAMLAHLGIHHPAEALAGAVAQGLAELREWIAGEAAAINAPQTETNDPLVRATARLINRMLPTAQLLDPLTGAWLAVESQRLWARHGVCPELIANLARSASSPIVFAGDYQTAYRMGQHAVALGASFGCEPETSLARQNFATFAMHWSERLENTIAQCAAAHSGLNQAGEVQALFINHITALAALFDCSPTLEGFSIELAAARDLAVRTGNALGFESLHTHRLLQALTGETGAAAMLDAVPEQKAAVRPLSQFGLHCSCALAALLFNDPPQLARASAALMPLLSHVGGAYRCMTARLARAVSLAQDARLGRHEQSGTLPAEFHALRDWFAERAADAPANYKHLLHFIDAEAAWTTGAASAAVQAFDLALQCCSAQTRPWHHALIAERAGVFHLAHGLDYAGRALLRDARERYAAWGATAVVSRLTAAHGFLDVRGDGHIADGESQSVSIESGAIDLLAILRASQALSSQTNIGGLHGCAVETLAAMTGATSVRLVIWDDELLAWCLLPVGNGTAEPIESAAARNAVPLSVFRIVERTRAPLVVNDAKLDDRFARDGYFSGMDRCSLLALPVLSQGTLRAVLILENRLSRGIFSHSRLNVVTLVASQGCSTLPNDGE